uniref:Uncharacterized protein n=1 Tax=Loa loa TaxID=7209 RepID=A0A1I7VGM8_LOALO
MRITTNKANQVVSLKSTKWQMYMKYDAMVPISQMATIVSTQLTAEHLIFGLVSTNTCIRFVPILNVHITMQMKPCIGE